METVDSVALSANTSELVTFNTPESIYEVDESKRAEVRAMTDQEQRTWAVQATKHVRELAVSTEDSLIVANNAMAAFYSAFREVLSGEAYRILGYASVDEYITGELSGLKLARTRQERS